MQNKNDYALLVYGEKKEYLCKIGFCHNVYRAVQWLNNSRIYSHWKLIRVYNRRTRAYIHTIYADNQTFIEPKPIG